MQSVNESCKYLGREPEAFALYAGDGRYVSAVSLSQVPGQNAFGFVHLAGREMCLSLARHEAVTVCHQARRAGVPAWIVRYPAGELA